MQEDSRQKFTFQRLELRVPIMNELTLCWNYFECKYPGNFTFKQPMIWIKNTFLLKFRHVIVDDVQSPNWHLNLFVSLQVAVVSFRGVEELHSWGLFCKVALDFLVFCEKLVDVPKAHGDYKFWSQIYTIVTFQNLQCNAPAKSVNLQIKYFSNMKPIEANPINISIAVVYCFFGVMSFFVLKISAKYFNSKNSESSAQKNQMEGKKMQQKYFPHLNFSKVFLKTYFFKNTLIGSSINQDKKYLLKEIFILSGIAVSCFNINSYIMWPWAVGLGLFVVTFVLSEIIVPVLSNDASKAKQLPEQSQIVLSIHQRSSGIGSIEIEINTRHQLSVSCHREQHLMSNRTERIAQKTQTSSKQPNLELLLIVILSLVSQILICVCIFKLSLSVSNSGVLNLVSFGISVLIDQVVVRLGLGIVSYTICYGLQKSQTINFFENSIFSIYCSQQIAKYMRKIHTQARVVQMGNKIANINNPKVYEDTISGQKMKMSNHFEYPEEIAEQILVPSLENVRKGGLFEEYSEEEDVQNDEPQISQVQPQSLRQIEPEVPLEPQVQIVIQTNIQPEQIIQVHPTKNIEQNTTINQTSWFQLYEHDIAAFTQPIYEIQQKPKKIKKRVVKQEQKFKSDPLLYFPYEQCKLSHRGSVNHELKFVNNQEVEEFQRQKSSFDQSHNNYLSHIEVLECVDDTIFNEEDELQIATVLYEKNLNIKTLTLNEKAFIPPTSRPERSETKRSGSKEAFNLKKIKKKSPYLVDLQSEAIRPTKMRKLHVSKLNKENANQTNQTFLPYENTSINTITQKDFNTIEDKTNQNQSFACR